MTYWYYNAKSQLGKKNHHFNLNFPLFYSCTFENLNTFENAFSIKILFLFSFLLPLIISDKLKNISPFLYNKLRHLVMNITFFFVELWLNRTFVNWELSCRVNQLHFELQFGFFNFIFKGEICERRMKKECGGIFPSLKLPYFWSCIIETVFLESENILSPPTPFPIVF